MSLKIKISPCKDGSYELEIPEELDYFIEKIIRKEKDFHERQERWRKQGGLDPFSKAIYGFTKADE